MVRLSTTVAFVTTASSLVSAAPSFQPQDAELTKRQFPGVGELPAGLVPPGLPPPNGEYALMGAAVFGRIGQILGEILGGLVGAGMPKDTSFNLDSIISGLAKEFDMVSAMMGKAPGAGTPDLSGIIGGAAAGSGPLGSILGTPPKATGAMGIPAIVTGTPTASATYAADSASAVSSLSSAWTSASTAAASTLASKDSAKGSSAAAGMGSSISSLSSAWTSAEMAAGATQAAKGMPSNMGMPGMGGMAMGAGPTTLSTAIAPPPMASVAPGPTNFMQHAGHGM